MPIRCGIAPAPRPSGQGLRAGYSCRQSTTGSDAPFATDHTKQQTSTKDYNISAIQNRPVSSGRRTGTSGGSVFRRSSSCATYPVPSSGRNILTGCYETPVQSSLRIIEPGGKPTAKDLARAPSVRPTPWEKSPADFAGNLRVMRSFGKHTAPKGYQGRRRADIANQQIERSTSQARSLSTPLGPANASWRSSSNSNLRSSCRRISGSHAKPQDTSVGVTCKAVRGADGATVLFVR